LEIRLKLWRIYWFSNPVYSMNDYFSFFKYCYTYHWVTDMNCRMPILPDLSLKHFIEACCRTLMEWINLDSGQLPINAPSVWLDLQTIEGPFPWASPANICTILYSTTLIGQWVLLDTHRVSFEVIYLINWEKLYMLELRSEITRGQEIDDIIHCKEHILINKGHLCPFLF
jgi:hypothetical protein